MLAHFVEFAVLFFVDKFQSKILIFCTLVMLILLVIEPFIGIFLEQVFNT